MTDSGDKRFYAAVAAMQGLCANRHDVGEDVTPKKVADWSVKYADALLAKLAETEPKGDPMKAAERIKGWLDEKCEHLVTYTNANSPDIECRDCGEVLK